MLGWIFFFGLMVSLIVWLHHAHNTSFENQKSYAELMGEGIGTFVGAMLRTIENVRKKEKQEDETKEGS